MCIRDSGYHFEHNYGHGHQNLSVVFAMLMMLAFLVDQVQQLCCLLFRAVWKKVGSKRVLWERIRFFKELRALWFKRSEHADLILVCIDQ